MKAIIIDDEPIYLYQLTDYCNLNKEIKSVHSFNSAESFLKAYNTNKELQETEVGIFDVRIGETLGTKLVNKINIPYIVFVSSYPEYALDAFEIEAVDFILKPFNRDRFNKSLARVSEIKILKDFKKQYEHLFNETGIKIKSGRELFFIKYNDIIYVQSYGDYIMIFYEDKRITTKMTLSEFQTQSKTHFFVKSHRCYLANKKMITKIGKSEIYLSNNIVLPISRRLKNEFIESIK